MDLASLLDTYRGPLIGLVVSWGAPFADAEEVAQDSFAQAWLKREQCRGDWRKPAVFGAWLRGVARNVWRNHARANRRRLARVRTSEEAVAGAETPNAPDTPDAVLEVRAAIERLARNQKEAVLMHYLERSPVADVAALLGVTVKTVEGRLYQARKNLRRMLAPDTDRALGMGILL